MNEMIYKPSKLGRTDLICSLWSDFFSRSVYGLQVSMCSGYDVWYVPPVVNKHTHTQTETQTDAQTDSFWPLILLARLRKLS